MYQNISKKWSNLPNLSKIDQKCIQKMVKIPQNIFETSSKFIKNLSKIDPKKWNEILNLLNIKALKNEKNEKNEIKKALNIF